MVSNDTYERHWNTSDSNHDIEAAIKALEQRREHFVNSAVFLCVALFLAVVLRELLKKIHFPHTVFLFVIGIILGVLDYHFKPFREFTFFAKQYIVIQLFLPVIIFNYAFKMNPYMFLMTISQSMILALPGFAFCATFNAVFAKTVFTLYEWDWTVCILFGTILCATDPSAILDLLKDYGVSSSLTTIIEGESMLNTGIALVVSKCILDSYEEVHHSVEGVVLDFVLSCLGAVAFGYIIAMATVTLMRLCENDMDMEVTFSLCISYITFFVSEIFLGISGLLTLVVLGVSVSAYKSSINYEEEETTLHQFWQTLSFWANSLIFTIVGLIITSGALNDLEYSDIGFILATYFAITVVRGFMIAVLSPFLRSHGYGFSTKNGAVLTWSGMRGAIGLAIALMARLTPMQGMENKLLIQVSGVIVLTLIFNASTMRWLLTLLGIGQVTIENMESMAHAVALLRDAANTTEQATRMDKYLAGVDWAWVHQVTQIENPYEDNGAAYLSSVKRTFNAFRGYCKECEAEIRIEPNANELRKMETDSRLMIMRALKTSVANQLEGYGILRRTFGLLNNCIDNTLDHSEKYLMTKDVKKKLLYINYYLKLLKKHMMDAMKRIDTENRRKRAEARLRAEETGSTAFRKWCVEVYSSKRLEHVLFLALLVNVIPIAGEFFSSFSEYRLFHHSGSYEKEIMLYEIFNAILALGYVCDAIIRISASGYKSYFSSKGNVIDFIVTLISVIQIFYGIVLMSVYRYTYSKETLYVLVALSCTRLVRLLRVVSTAVFTNVLNNCCSLIYNSFDLAIGFIVANEEIANSAHKIVEYEECADFARFTAVNNAHEMLCYIHEIEEENPHVVYAWRTHRAAIYILRNMKKNIEEMVDIYMLDENDAEHLLEQVAVNMKDALSAHRFLTSVQDVRNCLKNVQWINNDDVLNKIMETHRLQSFQGGEVIQEAGKVHSSMKVLYKGIIQITGSNSGERDKSLPNTDSMMYFNSIGNFSHYINYPKTLGLLGYLLLTPSVTNAVSSIHTQMITVDFQTISEIERELGSLSFHMWRPIALRIAFYILSEQHTFENWPEERLKIHLEEGIFPDLENVLEFDVHPVIADVVLIQGRVKNKDTDTVYTGPAFIPHSVTSLTLLDAPKDRPRVIMVLLQEEKYHAPSTMGWVETNEIPHKGLCLVHGIRRATVLEEQMQNEASGRRTTFLQTVGQLLKPKGGILESDAP